MSVLDGLPLRPQGPWLLVSPDREPVEDLGLPVRRIRGVVRRLDGTRMRDAAGLFAEFARALSFPDYFGANWAALEDCLSDLGWLPAPAYLLVVDAADDVLADEPLERTGLFADLLVRVARAWGQPVEDGDWWDRRAVPFHVVLVTASDPLARQLETRWRQAGATLARL
jgi:RNAse (barnase) inhibitor barstar